jgi:hypothetical protein
MYHLGIRSILLCAGLASMIWLAGCSEKEAFAPTLAGELAPDSLFKFPDAFRSNASDWANSGKSAGGMWQSKRIVVCNWQRYLARGFLRFSSLPDSTMDIIQATLLIYPTRLDGNIGGLSLGLYALAETLYQDNLFWGNKPGIEAAPLTDLSVPGVLGDSATADVTDIVSAWVKGERVNLGLAIVTDSVMGAPEGIVEFASLEAPTTQIITAANDTINYDYRPALRITYQDTVSHTAKYVISEDAFADTLTEPFAEDPMTIVCGNGFPSRAFMRFDLSSLPIEATVLRAVLRLTPDLEQSSFDSMEIRCHAVLDSTWRDFGSSIGISGAGFTVIRRDSLFPGETIDMAITALVQPLVSQTETDRGFVIRSADETADLDFIRFFSSQNADSGLVPRLEVRYSLPPEPPYSKGQKP